MYHRIAKVLGHFYRPSPRVLPPFWPWTSSSAGEPTAVTPAPPSGPASPAISPPSSTPAGPSCSPRDQESETDRITSHHEQQLGPEFSSREEKNQVSKEEPSIPVQPMDYIQVVAGVLINGFSVLMASVRPLLFGPLSGQLPPLDDRDRVLWQVTSLRPADAAGPQHPHAHPPCTTATPTRLARHLHHGALGQS